MIQPSVRAIEDQMCPSKQGCRKLLATFKIHHAEFYKMKQEAHTIMVVILWNIGYLGTTDLQKLNQA